MTFTALQDNSSVAFRPDPYGGIKIEYRINGTGEWQEGDYEYKVVLPKTGDYVQVRAYGFMSYTSSMYTDKNYSSFPMTGKIKVSGWITSLINNTGGDITEDSVSSRFSNLFRNCTALVDASELKLPNTYTIAGNYYKCMFYGCSELVSAPKVLPAIEGTAGSYGGSEYQQMFYGCKKLKSAPEIKLETMKGSSSCREMFYNCSALVDAPELNGITTLGSSGCIKMFQNCTSLKEVPSFPAATAMNSQCFAQMFQGCTNLVYVPEELPATNLSVECYYQMFKDCISLETPPKLEATSLKDRCYKEMFSGCTGLRMWYNNTDISDLTIAWTIPAGGTVKSDSLNNMFVGCTNSDFSLAEGGGVVAPQVGQTYFVKGPEVAPVKNAVTVNNAGNGTSFADRTKASAGDTITLYAIPASGYKFEKWSINGAEQTTNTFIMPAEAVTITATFVELPKYSITVTSDDESKGTVSTSLETAAEGTSVTITATPTSAYVFDKWVDVSGVTIDETNASVTFTMPDGNVSAKATFKEPAPDKYKININPDIEHGSIGVDKTEAAAGETVTLTVTPEEGYEFNAWEANVEIKDNKFEMPGNAVNITAFFKKAQPKPNPNPDNDTSSSSEPARVFVDLDTNKSEVEYGTVFMHNKDNVKMIFDMKVHSVDARTKGNQEFLAAAYAKNQGKRARVLITTGIYPRNKLYAKDLGDKKFLSFVNLEKKVQPVYAVCYNQTDKAYYLTGTMNANGTAVFPDFIARDATNITIFVLE